MLFRGVKLVQLTLILEIKTGQKLIIDNQGVTDNVVRAELKAVDSFGLGLKLVSQISEQQSWPFRVRSEADGFIAEIHFLEN
ncbi:hypothetical protein [Shewanella sp. UCD-KL12]|uniref:hypothetical protein n=1 Tax=Shewanella sp. UCD-KL12 TaxID=1917163 RepID=UPI00097024E7|nr:hypothetical protein [Shewanella sp. UCD-KL12]